MKNSNGLVIARITLYKNYSMNMRKAELVTNLGWGPYQK